jgi:hypothetical protein
MSALQPLSGGKRTHCGHVATAVFDSQRTSTRVVTQLRVTFRASSFDHLVGADEQGGWHGEAERSSKNPSNLVATMSVYRHVDLMSECPR